MIAMLRCGPSNRPFAATEKTEMAEFTHCGQSGLVLESALGRKVQERSNYGLLVIEKTVVVRSRKHQVAQVSLAPDRSQFFR